MRPRAALPAAIVAVLALLISGVSPAVATATTYRVDTTLRLPGQTSESKCRRGGTVEENVGKWKKCRKIGLFFK